MKKRVAILGSTGSIGTQALDVIAKNRDAFDVEVITAKKNTESLIEQALRFVPPYVVITDECKYKEVSEALSRLPIKVFTGVQALSEVVTLSSVDIVLTAMVGFSGLLPTISAIKSGKNLALANKETLVVAGELVTSLADENHVKIYPVDSEHSAIFQCLAGEQSNTVEKLILTASGGPFRGKTKKELEKVTSKEALMHPNWCMGNKITIDSATLMNKGFEAIEAKWLFGVSASQIDVIIHPQSIIHSIVLFHDGSMKAQMGLPDMRLPIQYALGYPERLRSDFPRFNFTDCAQLTFEKPDTEVFRNLQLAFEALHKGGNMPCILNAANEVVVDAFLTEKITFLEMPDIIEKVMRKIRYIDKPSLEDYNDTDREAREITRGIIKC